jgi:tetratricopeptide (TPR) repeat protein
LLVVGLAVALVVESPLLAPGRSGARGRGQANRSPLAILAYISLPIVAVLMSVFLNMQFIQADVIYKTGLQFDDTGQPQAAVPLFQRALALAPSEDYYYLFLGRAYLNVTNSLTDEAQRDQVLTEAEQQLKVARRLNPLNTDHTANLARLNRRWAELSADPTLRSQRAAAAHEYYGQATELSPNNAGLWNEWAALAFQVMGDPVTAQQKLDQSFALDALFEQTYLLQGDLHAWQARQLTEPDAQQGAFQQAIDAYLEGLATAETRGAPAGNLRVNLAAAYEGAGRVMEAILIYQQVLNRADAGVEPWRVNLRIAELYVQLGDYGQARAYGQVALEGTPETDKPNVQAWLDTLP